MAVTGQSLGIGLNSVTDYSPELPFLDLFKTSRAWITQSSSAWDTGETRQLDLDENGWVRSLPDPNQPGAPSYTQAGTLMLRDIPNAYPAGRYVVLYDGVGSIDYGLAARKIDGASVPGRDVIEVDASGGGINLRISQTDPQKTGDYIRNIRVYQEADLPLVELGLTFNPAFLQKVKEFSTLRFMDWMRTNGSSQQDWGQRSTANDASWASNDGVPVEAMVELANQTGVSPWFNMPHQANDDYIRYFAEYVRDHLDPNLTVYVEFSNEVWNWMFPQSHYAVQQAIDRWGDVEGGWMQWYGMRTAQMSQIWKSTFDTQASRVKAVMSTQTGWQGLENYLLDTPAWVAEGNQPAWQYVDAYAITGYFAGGLGLAENAETVKSWLTDPDGGFAKAFQQLRQGGLLPGQDSVLDTIASFQYHSAVAQSHGLQLVAYEGGQHIVNFGTISNNAADDAALTNFFIELNRRPEMQQLYAELLEGWKAAGGTLFNHFVDVAQSTRYGSWGALENLNQTSTPKYDALMNFIGTYDRWWSEQDSVTKLGLYTRGNSTNEIINGSNDNDILLGGTGDDVISGGLGQDRLHGEEGNDQVLGGTGNDRIIGGTGQDNLRGEAGDDWINGGSDNDTLNGGVGQDNLSGNAGNDTYFVDNLGDITTESVAQGTDTVRSSISWSLFDNLENLVLTGAEATSGTGNSLNNSILGNSAANTLTGGEGDDSLDGRQGNDRLVGGTGNDTYFVDSIGDVVTEALAQGTDTVRSNISWTLSNYFEHLILIGTDVINGDGNNLMNSITGNSAINVLKGGAGNDNLDGYEGDDTLLGGLGSDRLFGNVGSDSLLGGSGNDNLTGGLGTDQFSFSSAAEFNLSDFGADTIVDFSSGEDQISLSLSSFTQLASGVGPGFSTATEFAIVTKDGLAATSAAMIVYNASNGKLFYNPNGTNTGFGAGGRFATLSGSPVLSAADFVIQA